MELLVYITLVTSIVGGIIAYKKDDYFSRGFFICLFTGIFGLIAIILSSKSEAKAGNEIDYHSWPQYGAYAVFLLLGFVIIALLISFIA